MVIETNNPIMGRNISFLRRRKRISRKKLADLIGMNQNTLFCIEHQTIRYLNDQQLTKLCKLFAITVEELMEKEIQ